MSVRIRSARPGEGGVVLALVRELAAYERLAHEVVASEEELETGLFGAQPRVFCDIAERAGHDGSDPLGFALWFYNFSTFRGRHGIYLEDLYVRPAARGQGIGQAFLAGLARRCVEQGLPRLEWSVLDWNEPALRFYRGLGAEPMADWTVQRVTGDALARLAERAR